MAQKPVEDNPPRGQAANTAVQTAHGDHDRVVMPSLYADGSLAQTPNVELIGDREVSRRLMREQFAQQAVSAADVAAKGVRSTPGAGLTNDPAETGDVHELEQDPTVADLQARHEQVAEAARAAADKLVDSLFTTDPVLEQPARSGGSRPDGAPAE